jgi:hypothetical protein
MKEGEKGEACDMHGIKKCNGFWWGNTKEKEHLEELSVGGRIVLKETGWQDVDWTHLAPETDTR